MRKVFNMDSTWKDYSKGLIQNDKIIKCKTQLYRDPLQQ